MPTSMMVLEELIKNLRIYLPEEAKSEEKGKQNTHTHKTTTKKQPTTKQGKKPQTHTHTKKPPGKRLPPAKMYKVLGRRKKRKEHSLSVECIL